MSKKAYFAAGAVALGLAALSGTAWSQAQPQAAFLTLKPGALAVAKAPEMAAPVVSVTGGKTAGGIYGDVAVYRAIPFAAPPVGDLRWRAPHPVKPWSGVRKGIDFGGSCGLGEDCLYLNVYKPVDVKATAKLPVMVWIYGGGFTAGSADAQDSQPFTKNGVVYVSLNYRLGRTGWYSASAISKNAPKDETVGNYGLQDQIAALKWIQANIAKFGGDPKRVTVFGESAGAISINFLMTTPQAKGLFQQAISESGFARWDPRPLADTNAAGDAFFAEEGIKGDGPDALAKMRALPFSALNGPMSLGNAGPINDGKLLRQGITEGFEKGLDAKIPYLVGGNSNEASLFPSQDPPGRLAKIKAGSPAVSAVYDALGGGNVNREISAIVTDFYITEPDRAVARLHDKHGAPTYRYFISYVTPAQRATAFGLGHAGELGYVFARPNAIAAPEDLATSQSIIAYWTAFAKYGTPGAAGGLAWPKYDSSDSQLEIGVDGLHTRTGLLKGRLDWMEANHKVVEDSGPHLIPAPGARP
jgi:para-nitrobenzyl esterase